MRTLPLNEVKTNLSAVLDEVQASHEPVTITRHGKPAGVLVSAEDLDTLLETLAWLSDRDHAAEMAEADAAVEAGDTLSLDEVEARLARRR
ncbi:type II toxin-antitoxin system Phd/YefM family antitoxin [Cellulomonas sp.]|uniref:type II toxin-antitoxin system Phd/YefM family antitoxin n=1 Tax=Cellulomonas sp. TaxID=40001 RepID=UPI002D34FD5F|nr:type II toxin-antitoxin system Phd/YefM family antitoxin [Cellulomonas sp.]HYQ76057.1 type II toxin-antitoxin system Phd/YefM family antitoxin [Cellulomonas sp.]